MFRPLGHSLLACAWWLGLRLGSDKKKRLFLLNTENPQPVGTPILWRLWRAIRVRNYHETGDIVPYVTIRLNGEW